VIENDSLMKHTMKWNSSENMLTLVEDEKERDQNTEIFFLVNLVGFLIIFLSYLPHFLSYLPYHRM